jgi:hypothetical protein
MPATFPAPVSTSMLSFSPLSVASLFFWASAAFSTWARYGVTLAAARPNAALAVSMSVLIPAAISFTA